MPDLLLPLIVLGLSMSLTPGPNNLMIAASGANFGWRRSMPLYLGILAGFVSLLFAVGFGLGTVFEEFPTLHGILRYLGAGYLVWLGVRIATGWGVKTAPAGDAANASSGSRGGKPFSFLQAAAFQWVNPKAWVLAVGAMAAFTLPDRSMTPQVLMIVLVLGAMAVGALWLWLASGLLAAR